MKKLLVFLVFASAALIAASSWAETMVPSHNGARKTTEEWISPKNYEGDITLGEEWITYYNSTPAYIWWGGPERATWFDPSDFPNAVYPFWIKKVRTEFVEQAPYMWGPCSLFTFKIYGNDGFTLLYESDTLTANKRPTKTEHDLGADSVEISSLTFYVSVHPTVCTTDTFNPMTLTDGVFQGHTYFGVPGAWGFFMSGEASHEAYVSWGGLQHDVYVMDILTPGYAAKVDTSYPVRVNVKNNGTDTETFDVVVLIMAGIDTVYADTQNVAGLTGGQVRTIVFANWTPLLYGQQYNVKAKTLLPTDQNPNNDELTKITETYEYGEIAYDDFEQDGWWVVSQPSGPQDAFGVKFIPYFAPPFRVHTFKIYVNDAFPFDNVRLCPDNLGVPDYNNPYDEIATPNASNPPEWIVRDFDSTQTYIATSQPIWLCAQFANGGDGPPVGGDDDPPFSLKSYYTQDFSLWNLVAQNFMMRVVHLPTVGVEEEFALRRDVRTRLYQNSPNPFRRSTTIKFTISLPVHASLKVYDVGGGLVRTLQSGTMEPGIHSVTWDGKDEIGRDVAAGVYFYKLNAARTSETMKLIMVE